MDASVPGCVHTDLFAAGKITDPYYGCNEETLQWIGNEDWEYEKTFLIESSLLEYSHHELVFEGLDTYADVYLNGSHILSADNMFREWRADCGTPLRAGENTIRVVFHSPLPIEERCAGEYPYRLPGGNRVFTRKAAYHYGWDWGPRFVTSGIWKPAHLEAWEGARLRNVSFILGRLKEGLPEKIRDRQGGKEFTSAEYVARLEIEADRQIEAAVEITVDGEMTAIHEPGRAGEASDRPSVDLGRGNNSIDLNFEIPSPELWWPNGTGEQRLYEIRTALFVDGKEAVAITKSVGVRTVGLVTERSGGGESFYFTINGRPVFMKGANYVPMESFPSKVDYKKYESLVESAADAKMNMLRVWGGGIYENDIFYSLCDRHGILVWQDFMFACAMYPWDEGFLGNVRIEAIENVRRLADHPCIALWCGNNEIDEAWHNWGWQDGYKEAETADIWEGYEKLFHRILPEIVNGCAGTAPYISSSPKYGRGDRRSLTDGDCHYWGVWHDAEPFEILNDKTGRFMSEFGFQSFPSMETMARFSGLSAEAPAIECLESPELLCHQKHPRGNQLILEYMRRDFKVPRRFEDFVYVSQLLQARGVRMGIEAQRRAAPFCMGSLYWQLNDCWPVASWSGIDYFGERKALYYQAAKSFSPRLISPVVENDTIKVHFVCDTADFSIDTLRLDLIDFHGKVLKKTATEIPASLEANRLVYKIPRQEMLGDHDPGAVVLKCELLRGRDTVTKNLLYFASPKNLVLPSPSIETIVREFSGGGGYLIELRTDVIAKNVYLSMQGCGGTFSDNFFDMLAGDSVTVFYETKEKLADAGKRLMIKTLADVQ